MAATGEKGDILQVSLPVAVILPFKTPRTTGEEKNDNDRLRTTAAHLPSVAFAYHDLLVALAAAPCCCSYPAFWGVRRIRAFRTCLDLLVCQL